jgi:hypothetical protein
VFQTEPFRHPQLKSIRHLKVVVAQQMMKRVPRFGQWLENLVKALPPPVDQIADIHAPPQIQTVEALYRLGELPDRLTVKACVPRINISKLRIRHQT